MKIQLSFSTLPLSYKKEIVVLKNTISKNDILAVNIFGHQTLHFTRLEGFHTYSIQQWRHVLEETFSDNSLSLERLNLTKPFFNIICPRHSYKGELLFIIESVLLAILKKERPQYFFTTDKTLIRINSLFQNFSELKSVNCLKIKIRPEIVTNNLFFNELKNYLDQHPSLLLRLDGNRCFLKTDLILFLKTYVHFLGISALSRIEYIEEPTLTLCDFFSANSSFNIPLALDEGVLNFLDDPLKLQSITSLSTLVLKPSLIGISKCQELIEIAKKLKLNCVISSSYESASVLFAHLYLASLLPQTYHGLDTLKFLPDEYSKIDDHFILGN